MTSIGSEQPFAFEALGWRYYNKLKKKAMEQEFSWSGLVVSLSIAFFIVIITALSLSILYQSTRQVGLLTESASVNSAGISNGGRAPVYLPVEISGQKMERIERLNLS